MFSTLPCSIPRSFISVMFIWLIFSPNAFAQITFGPTEPDLRGEATIRDLNWMNNNYLDKQRRIADDLTRSKFGRQLRQNKRDLAVIQRLIDEKTLDDANKQTLQAFGAAMGDVMVNQHRKLNWKVYEDEQGASHAVCLEDTKHCLFPMTMISRRIEAGLKPDVTVIFDNAISAIKPYFPHVPYSRTK